MNSYPILIHSLWVDENLEVDLAYVDKLAERRVEHDRWIVKIENKGRIPEADYIGLIWPNGTQPEVVGPVTARHGQTVSISCRTPGASIGYQVVAAGRKQAGDGRYMLSRSL